MGEVVFGDFNTRLDLPADRILDGAKANGLSTCLVVGRKPDGEFYAAGTTDDAGQILILLERAKRLVMEWVN